jgi:hypothetical protein
MVVLLVMVVVFEMVDWELALAHPPLVPRKSAKRVSRNKRGLRAAIKSFALCHWIPAFAGVSGRGEACGKRRNARRKERGSTFNSEGCAFSRDQRHAVKDYSHEKHGRSYPSS